MKNITAFIVICFLASVLIYDFFFKDKSNIEVNILQNKIDSLESIKISQKDTLIVYKDRFKKSIEYKDKIKVQYVEANITDTNCTNYVGSLEVALDDCNKLVGKQDTFIQVIEKIDTFRSAQVQILKKENKFAIVVGAGAQVGIDGVVRPGLGAIIGFKIK